MYCKRCFAELPSNPRGAIDRDNDDGRTIEYATDYSYACTQCGRVFDPKRRRTYLLRRFPSYWQVILTIGATTLFGIACAWVVSIHQMTAMSGH